MPNKPVAFLSYAHVDDNYGQLSEFRDRLSNEVQVQTGDPFPIFQDRDDIFLGQNWRQRIEHALEDEVTFLIPIVSPSFFKREPCREELELFFTREKKVGRNDLVLPVYYVSCRVLDDEKTRQGDPLAQAIAARQWADWRGLRFEPFESVQVRKALMQIATQIRLALDRISTSAAATPPVKVTKPAKAKKVSLFLSCSHKDELFARRLQTHLEILIREGLIDSWYDARITPGHEGGREVSKAMEAAQIILLLISADYLASDYCYSNEVFRALERHRAGEAVVIPVILRACDWGGAPFAKLQALPPDAKPIASWRSRDEAFHAVAEGIAKAALVLLKRDA